MCHHTKFCQNQPNGFEDIAIFSIIKMAAVRHLEFSVFKIFGHPSHWEV